MKEVILFGMTSFSFLFLHLPYGGFPKYIFLSLGNTTLILEVERKMKKFFAVAVATVMTLALAAPAFAADIETGLIAKYSFEDSLANDAADSDATLNKGTAAYVDGGIKGKAFDFSANAGTSTLANAAVAIALDKLPTTTAFTVSYWVKNDATGTALFFDGCCQYFQFCSNNTTDAFAASRAAMSSAFSWESAVGDHWRTGKVGQDTSKWTMLTYTVSATGKATVYVDGVEVSTYWDEANYTDDGWFAYSTDNGSTYLNMFSDDAASWTDVGFIGSGDWWNANFSGLMDEVCIYERELSAADVAALYAAPTATETETEDATETGDMTAVLPVAILAVAAMAVVVVMRKRTVAE
ncbi:MAG: LamG domain-containing protein [Lachnospiraceae bacterium]|nr:LamG domain-containing protein [Lachnospiraceae bacterium]